MASSSPFKTRLEKGFDSWGRFVFRFRWLVLLASLTVCGGLASLLPQIRVDNSHESFLHEDAPALELYQAFRKQFGQDSVVMVVITPPEIFDLAFLEKLRRFHEEVEQALPYVDEVNSLINARQTRGEGDTLIVEDLLEVWPESAEDLADLRTRVFANPLYVDQLISRDATLTVVIIRPTVYVLDDFALNAEGDFDADEATEPRFVGVDEKSELVAELDEIVERYQGDDFPIELSGGSVVGARMNSMLRSDVTKYMSACWLVILLLLLFLFRRVSGVLLPAALVAATLLSTFGSMVLMDIAFSMTVQMLPIIVMCVVVCNVIHVSCWSIRPWPTGRAGRTPLPTPSRTRAWA